MFHVAVKRSLTPIVRRRMLAGVFLLSLLSPVYAQTLTVGIVAPRGPMLASAEAAESLRQSMIRELQAKSIDVVPLAAPAEGLVDAEAQSKHCRYILYTHLEKHAAGGLRSRLSMLGGVMPFGSHGNPIGNAAAPGGASYASLKQGESVTLAYRLMAVGAQDPVQSENLESGKAGADGEDVISPVVPRLADAVSAAAQGKSASPPTAAADPAPAQRSSFGGLFGHRSVANNKPPSDMAAGMDCTKHASMPNAAFSAESCEKMKASQQAYAGAAADPSAARTGDDEMTCSQIMAEMKQQPFKAADAAQRAEGAKTVQGIQEAVARGEAALVKQQAEDQAIVAAATVVDTKTELATAGVVHGRAMQAAEKVMEAKHKAAQAELTRENMPAMQQQFSFMGNASSDYAEQLKSNPRLARLVQLAQTKRCKGGS